MSNKEDAILRITESMVRKGGYNGFSFREIAKEVGIKSASVHYHFPTKEDLGVAVTDFYTERFFSALGDVDALLQEGIHPLEQYIAIFRDALVEDKRMCLCGLLGAEVDGLPDAVADKTKTFFARNITWLTEVFEKMGSAKTASKKAAQVLSLLEGALIASNVMQDVLVFDNAAQLVLDIS